MSAVIKATGGPTKYWSVPIIIFFGMGSVFDRERGIISGHCLLVWKITVSPFHHREAK